MTRLKGKVVLLSGTARGMGRGAALRFAAEGAVVAGGDLHADEAGETLALIDAAVFLASDDASYITGANLVVDGGWSSVLPGAPSDTEDT